jgi:membrane protein
VSARLPRARRVLGYDRGVADSLSAKTSDAKGRVAGLRARLPAVDRAVRAYGRYDESRGNQLAAAMTFYGFLSFFPLLALAFALLGYAVEWAPDVRAEVTALIRDTLPGLVGDDEGQINVQRIADARAGAGILGLLGLLWTGTGWVDAVRESLRVVFGTGKPGMRLPVRKAWDVAVLAALGTAVLASLALSGVTTALAGAALAVVGLDGSAVAGVVLQVLSLLVVLAADVCVFTILFVRLPGHRPPWRQVVSGAVVGAVGFEILKIAGTFLVARATSNPVYAGVAVSVGLLVWTNLASRLVVFAASWAATQPVPAAAPDERAEEPPDLARVGAPAVPSSGDAMPRRQEGRQEGRQEDRQEAGRTTGAEERDGAATRRRARVVTAAVGLAVSAVLWWRSRSSPH